MAASDESARVFAELKRLLQRHARRLVVVKDGPTEYYLDTKTIHPRNQRRICFGCTAVRKNFVSYYLMPVYAFPELLKGISPQLKKRMQGKSCFNFKTIDKALFKELSDLTKKSFDRFRSEGWI